MFRTCPGLRKFIRPYPEFLNCPHCGENLEIWSDEDVINCYVCNKEVTRPSREPSCLDWCEYADKCRQIIKSKKR